MKRQNEEGRRCGNNDEMGRRHNDPRQQGTGVHSLVGGRGEEKGHTISCGSICFTSPVMNNFSAKTLNTTSPVRKPLSHA